MVIMQAWEQEGGRGAGGSLQAAGAPPAARPTRGARAHFPLGPRNQGSRGASRLPPLPEGGRGHRESRPGKEGPLTRLSKARVSSIFPTTWNNLSDSGKHEGTPSVTGPPGPQQAPVFPTGPPGLLPAGETAAHAQGLGDTESVRRTLGALGTAGGHAPRPRPHTHRRCPDTAGKEGACGAAPGGDVLRAGQAAWPPVPRTAQAQAPARGELCPRGSAPQASCPLQREEALPGHPAGTACPAGRFLVVVLGREGKREQPHAAELTRAGSAPAAPLLPLRGSPQSAGPSEDGPFPGLGSAGGGPSPGGLPASAQGGPG